MTVTLKVRLLDTVAASGSQQIRTELFPLLIQGPGFVGHTQNLSHPPATGLYPQNLISNQPTLEGKMLASSSFLLSPSASKSPGHYFQPEESALDYTFQFHYMSPWLHSGFNTDVLHCNTDVFSSRLLVILTGCTKIFFFLIFLFDSVALLIF